MAKQPLAKAGKAFEAIRRPEAATKSSPIHNSRMSIRRISIREVIPLRLAAEPNSGKQ